MRSLVDIAPLEVTSVTVRWAVARTPGAAVSLHRTMGLRRQQNPEAGRLVLGPQAARGCAYTVHAPRSPHWPPAPSRAGAVAPAPCTPASGRRNPHSLPACWLRRPGLQTPGGRLAGLHLLGLGGSPGLGPAGRLRPRSLLSPAPSRPRPALGPRQAAPGLPAARGRPSPRAQPA